MTQFGFQQRPFGATGSARRIPDGYAPVAISRAQADAPVRLCVLVRKQAESVGGHLVSLRETLDARVFLGALCDAAGSVHDWLEIWVQTVDGLMETPASVREPLTNAALDARWARMCDAWTGISPGAASGGEPPIRTGMESGSDRMPPTWIDVQKLAPFHPGDVENPWLLCTDDAALAAAGLPPWSTTLHRYLTNGHGFAPVTRGAPTTDRCKALKDVIPAGLISLAPEGGRLMVRRLAPMAFETYVSFLGDPRTGEIRFGVPHGRAVVELDNAAEREAGTPAGAFVLDHHGPKSRLIEQLFLKLRLLADAIGSVRGHAAATARPLLNLRLESFRVRLSGQARGLPRLWSARAELVDPGDAIPLPIRRAVDVAYFLPGRMSGPGAAGSIFRPEAVSGDGGTGTGQLRIRQVLTQGTDETILEGTLTGHDRVRAAKNDLVSLRVGLGSGKVDLFGRVQSDTALAGGELRLRTLPQRLAAGAADNLRAAEGVPLSGVSFEVLPLLSTPCDLYSLGVIAVRTLLVGGKDGPNTLAVALDETLSLSRELAAGWSAEEPAWKRVGKLFALDKRWFDSLGPQRLSAGESLTPEQALALIPADIWFRVLATIAAMFPGIGKDSTCADFGDAAAAGPQLIFDPALTALDDLLTRSRSLIVVDRQHNREVHAVLRRFSTGVAGGGGGGLRADQHAQSNGGTLRTVGNR